jgi:hypothetical protein
MKTILIQPTIIDNNSLGNLAYLLIMKGFNFSVHTCTLRFEVASENVGELTSALTDAVGSENCKITIL